MKSLSYIFTLCSLVSSISLAFDNSCHLSNGPKLNIAHRGNESEYLENSLPSFAGAAQVHADMVELDVVYTSDDKPLVAHDADFSRTIFNCQNLQGQAIRNHSYQEITQDCRFNDSLFFHPSSPQTTSPGNFSIINNLGYDIYSVPLLQQVISTLQQTTTGILIELKGWSQSPAVPLSLNKKILDLLVNLDPQQECNNDYVDVTTFKRTFNCFRKIKIMSFDSATMDYLSLALQADPRYAILKGRVELLKLVWMTSQYEEHLLDPSSQNDYWNVDGVAFRYNLTADSSFDKARFDHFLDVMNCQNSFSKNKKKYVFTAHNSSDIEYLKTRKIDGIINGIPRYFGATCNAANPRPCIPAGQRPPRLLPRPPFPRR